MVLAVDVIGERVMLSEGGMSPRERDRRGRDARERETSREISGERWWNRGA